MAIPRKFERLLLTPQAEAFGDDDEGEALRTPSLSALVCKPYLSGRREMYLSVVPRKLEEPCQTWKVCKLVASGRGKPVTQ
jgi:hypothetical protein